MCSQASRNAHKGRGGGGRGNLRENREDPAPTVGRLRGYHCDPHRAQRPPIGAAMPHMETLILYSDAARRVVIPLHAIPLMSVGRK